jgi:hypothetical protein
MLESIKRKKVPRGTEKYLFITKKKLDLEEIHATNKDEENLLRHAQGFLPRSHKLEETSSLFKKTVLVKRRISL